jgi:hypothetical protein
MKKFISVAFLISMMVHPAMSAEQTKEKMRIAVMDLKGTMVAARTVATISNMLRNDLINMAAFVVVERAQMDAILKEHAFQQTGCTDQSCAAEMGKLLSAKKILVGEVSTLGKSIMMTVRIVDVEKGISEFAANEKAESEEVLDQAVENIAKKLAARIDGRGDEQASANRTPAGYYLRGFVPGWAQFSSGYYGHATVFGAAFWGGAVWTLLAVQNYSKSRSDYNKLGPNLPQSKYNSAYNKYNNDMKIRNYSIIGLAAIYGLNWVDVLFFTKPEGDRTAGMFKHGNVYMNVSTNMYREYNSSDKRTELSATMTF